MQESLSIKYRTCQIIENTRNALDLSNFLSFNGYIIRKLLRTSKCIVAVKFSVIMHAVVITSRDKHVVTRFLVLSI